VGSVERRIARVTADDLGSGAFCRSIKTLRPSYTETVTDEEVRAAALRYVRKVSGF
jgi:hypothetical protein